MKRAIPFLLLSSSATFAEDLNLGTINVESKKLSDVSGEEVKSADLADALAKKVPSVSLVRRSGIANDIILRGQKKDNINILIDNAKVYGACPNRMDPPTSHILTNNIDGIEIIEGPYDVENFGTLSGAVKITTVKPSEDLSGEVSVNFGSWNYQKTAATVSGGNDTVRFLLSASNETSDQYEDGDGNDFYQQIENLNTSAGVQYKDIYRDIAAYEKKTLMGKMYVDITENQELMLSYTANRSDDILYPSSKMDALYDDSDIFNLEYSITNLGKYSKDLDIQFYDSQVEHPMSTFYRNSSGANSVNEMISYLETHTQGVKVTNSFDLDATSELTVGFDASNRNWDGTYQGIMTMMNPPMPPMFIDVTGRTSIDDVDTENMAVFAEIEKQINNINLKAGVRYDDTTITPGTELNQPENDYSYFSANVFASVKSTENTRYFAGVGQASRVPDARELYFNKVNNTVVGTPDLKETSNLEVDFGVENKYDSFTVKTKLFHSWLTDYIYFNADKEMTGNAFENIDATIYGIDVSGAYFFNDEFNLDFGLAYQRGEKDQALAGQTNTDLAEIPPLKANVALNYDYASNSTATAEVVAADAWDNYDSDNGEQALSGYGVMNLKVQHAFNRSFELTVGIDNAFDKTYAVTNTYKDLTLLADGTGDIMLMNEPGRYYYVNAAYKF